MIRNNNRSVPFKLSTRSLRTGRLRNFFIILTVVLSVALLAGASFTELFFMEKEKRSYDNRHHVVYTRTDEAQIEALENDDRIEDIYVYKQAAGLEIENYIVRPIYSSRDAKIIESISIAEGRYPEEINEIAVDKAYMRQIGKDAVIGESLSFSFLDGSTEEFVISGFTDFDDKSNVYSLMFSKAYAEQGSQLKDVAYSTAARAADAGYMQKYEFLDTVRQIAEDHGIARPDVNENNAFADTLSMSSVDMMFIIIIGISILLISMVVIYSIFYISVTGRIRQFGQLRTLGCTAGQIKRLVSLEGAILCIIGAPIGILLGVIFAYVIAPQGFKWQTVIIGSFIILLIDLFTILLSLRKPAKIAAKVSPIEASKTSAYTGKAITDKKSKKRSLSPFGLAKISAERNRKKSFMTSLSLAIGGVLFVLGATVLVSMNIEDYSRQSDFKFGEFNIYFSSNAAQTNEHGQTGLQLDNPFDDELFSEIMAIEGVGEIVEFKSFKMEYEYNNYRLEDEIASFAREDVQWLKDVIDNGSIDYDQMLANKEIIITDNAVAKEIFGWKFEIGDTVKTSWYDGEQMREDEFKIAADLNFHKMVKNEKGSKIQLESGWFIFPEETLASMLPENFNRISSIVVKTTDYKKYGESVDSRLVEIVDENPNLKLYTLQDRILLSESTFNSMYTLIFAFAAFIIGFSLINLINTLVSNIMARKTEFAVMRSIGMSNRQLNRMIQIEGLILAVKNIVVTVLLGNICGCLLIVLMQKFSADYMRWHIPWIYILAYSVLTIAAPLIISAAIIKTQNKKSLIEKLREIE